MKRLVVKIGTSTLTTPEGELDEEFIGGLAEIVACQVRSGLQVVMVTSGAVGAGVGRLRIPRPRSIPHKQAAAAVGQGILMGVYAASFERCGLATAQILLTRRDVADRSAYTHAHNTFRALFHYGVVPIVNENDSVAIEEIQFGDNDTLSAIVALIADADLVVNLSNIQGLFDPATESREIIPVVQELTEGVEALARPAEPGPGTGGMVTKMRAARILTRAGIPLIIGSGRDPATIPGAVERWKRCEQGKEDPGFPGTLFLPAARRLKGRKRWIAYGQRARGAVVVNDRARRVLVEDGRSLLAAGIVEVTGQFQPGDLVRIVDFNGQEVGRGLVNFSREEVEVICGHQSDEIPLLLGRDSLPEVIHRDNLVVGA